MMRRFVLTEVAAAPAADLAAGEPGVQLAQGHARRPEIQTPCPPDHFVTAWLLLLLDIGVTHGYELCRELVARDLEVGLPILYRKLRRLERDGLTESRWTSSAAGPRRRTYRLTDDGRRRLQDATVLVTALREQHNAFLRAHEGVRMDPETGVGGGPTDQREGP